MCACVLCVCAVIIVIFIVVLYIYIYVCAFRFFVLVLRLGSAVEERRTTRRVASFVQRFWMTFLFGEHSLCSCTSYHARPIHGKSVLPHHISRVGAIPSLPLVPQTRGRPRRQ